MGRATRAHSIGGLICRCTGATRSDLTSSIAEAGLPVLLVFRIQVGLNGASSMLSCITGWRHANVPIKCHAECACGAVANKFSNFGNTIFCRSKQIFCQGHAPSQQILYRRCTHHVAKPFEECRTRKRSLSCELSDCPVQGRALMHTSYRHRQALIGQSAQQS